MDEYYEKMRQADLSRENRYALRPYLISDGREHPFAVICPGGGYRKVANYVEGHPFALELNKRGFHAFVVYYRVREKGRFPAPQEDLARAIREIFDHSEEWMLDTQGYSIWGSSAGGHLAASFCTDQMGFQRYNLPGPGALILCYPVITMGEKTHAVSRNNLLGEAPTQAQIRLTSIQHQITSHYPPTFLWWGDQDTNVHPDNSRMMLAALKAKNVPCRGIAYPGVEHGAGLGRGLSCEGWIEEAVEFWMKHR